MLEYAVLGKISIFVPIASNITAVTAAAVNFKIIEKVCQAPIPQAVTTLSSGAAVLSLRIMEFRRNSALNFLLHLYLFLHE